jgi:hypothetical protein
MKKAWSTKGLRNPTPGPGQSHSARRMGTIPFISKAFVGLRIRGAEKLINKLEDKVETMVGKARQKVDSIVAAAKKTDSAALIEKAKGLQDRLEKASCVEPEFREGGDDKGGGRAPSLTAQEKHEIKIKCIRGANSAAGVLWKSGTGHGGDAKYPTWKDAYDVCFKEEVG